MHSRYDVALEQYALSVGVEARSTLEVGATVILPAAMRFQTELAQNVHSLKKIGYDADTSTLDSVSGAISALQAGIAGLAAALDADGPDDVLEEAAHVRDTLLPAISAVRSAADELETVVADDLWPLATYQEMLFIL